MRGDCEKISRSAQEGGKEARKSGGSPFVWHPGGCSFGFEHAFPKSALLKASALFPPRSAFGQVFSFRMIRLFVGYSLPEGAFRRLFSERSLFGRSFFSQGAAVFADILFPGRLLIKYLIPEGPPFCRVFAPPESLPFGRRAHIKSRSVRADAGRTRRSKEGRRGLL